MLLSPININQLVKKNGRYVTAHIARDMGHVMAVLKLWRALYTHTLMKFNLDKAL